jgi:hypothetical protein
MTSAEEYMRPEEDPSWLAYPETVLELHGSRTVRIDLRETPSLAVLDEIRAIGLAEPFAVVTAWDPCGMTADASHNERADARLRAILDDSGLRWIRADGVSVDGSHRERGVAVATTVGHAGELARTFRQSAIFWFEDGVFWLMPGLVRAEPLRLPAERTAAR